MAFCFLLAVDAIIPACVMLRMLCQGVETSSGQLLCQCSRLAAKATPQQQAAARASADDVAAAVAAQQHALHGAHTAAAAAQGQEQLPGAALLAPGKPDPLVITAEQALNLSSRPTAKHKLLLDFDGYVLDGSVWNTITKRDKIVSAGYDKDGDPSSFSAEELAGRARTLHCLLTGSKRLRLQQHLSHADGSKQI
jgi:hypothetical protein